VAREQTARGRAALEVYQSNDPVQLAAELAAELVRDRAARGVYLFYVLVQLVGDQAEAVRDQAAEANPDQAVQVA
jgi:hypothetical protein